MAISSDIERTSPDVFEELMRFLNTRQVTGLGDGLGLEVTGSLFFFSHRADEISYFAGMEPNDAPSAEATRLRDYLATGRIDTNHSFGDFGAGRPFSRDHALAALRALDQAGAAPSVFTNHGGSPSNFGGHEAAYEGDLPGSGSYHADLLPSAGVRHVWLDDATSVVDFHRVRADQEWPAGA